MDMMQDPSYNAALGSQIMDAPQNHEPQNPEQQPVISNEAQVDIEIRDMINKRKLASKTWRDAKRLIWDKCYNHYKQIYDSTNKEAWQSTTFIPASPKVAEVIAANMHTALLAPDKPVEYQANQPENEQTVADVNDLIYLDAYRSEFKVHWTDLLRTLCIIGTGIGKIEYQKETAWVTIKKKMRQIPGMDMMRSLIGLAPAPTETTTQEQATVKDWSSMRNVDPYNFFPEPGSIEIDKDHWCIEEGKVCNYKLIQLSKDQENPIRNVTDEVLMSGQKDVDQNNPDKQLKDFILDEQIKIKAYLDPDQEHVLDEYWGPAPIWMLKPELYGKEEHKYEMVNAWFWLIDGIHVVRAQLTPFRDAEPPYVKGVYIRVPGQFWGIGPLELMLGLQVELNEIRNTRQDEVNLKLNKPMAVLKDHVDKGDWDRLKAGPGALWPFTNTDDVRKVLQEIQYDANTQDSWRSSGEILNEIQEVTAATKATVGTGGGSDQSGGDTFRGQLLNKQTSSDRFIMYARILEITGLSKAYKKMYQRIYQFKDWNTSAQSLGEKRAAAFNFVSPEDLEMMAKMVPLGVTTMENKGVKLAQKAQEFQMFSPYPWFKMVDAARQMVTIGGDIPDQTIMSEEELQQFNQMRRQMISAAGQPPMPPDQGPEGQQAGPPSQPIAGNTPPPMGGMPPPAMQARGPGASPIDGQGMPMS
jgi:hypothetical protein